jgi:aspartate racemase
MTPTRCLGLIGGLGVGATVHYYAKLVKAHEARGLTPEIVIAHAQTPRVFDYVAAKDPNGLAEYLVGYIRRMKQAGADIAVVPAVTPHYCVRQLIAASPLPLVNIFDPIRKNLAERAFRRVAIFGTRFVVESSLFGELSEMEVVPPKLEESDYIHNAYVELARLGQGSQEAYDGLTAMARRLIDRERLDAIILAGTDLALLFNESNTHFPHVDCAELHIQAIMAELVRDASPDLRQAALSSNPS